MTSGPWSLEYQFASAKTIVQVALQINDLNSCPASFSVQYFDGSTWQTAWTESTTYCNDTTYQRIFSDSSADTSASAYLWRIYCTTVQGGVGNLFQAAEIEMRATLGGADQTAAASTYDQAIAGTVNSTFYPRNPLANNGTTTKWASNGAVPQWLGYSFISPVTVEEISMTAPSDMAADSPTAIEVQYWNGSTWVLYWSVSGISTWSTSQTKVFTKPASSGRRRQMVNC